MKAMFAVGFLGGWDWVIIVLAILLLFGSKRIPDLARSLGQSIKEFKKGAREVTDEIQNAGEEKSPPAAKPAPGGPPPSQTVSQSTNPPKA